MDPFEIADSLRYVDDIRLSTFMANPNKVNSYEAGLALNSLRISKEITPDIHASLSAVCSTLGLELDQVRAYVTCSSELQAGCINSSRENCVLTVSSEIINLLSFDEIKFVLGHELGHFLLGHSTEQEQVENSLEANIKKRAQEISVDRIGLLACKDIDIATRAIVKTLSGLDNKYLNFDIQSFLRQLDSEIAKNEETGKYSSHPSFILRAKALLRFSLSDPYQKLTNGIQGSSLSEIDKLIQNDLNKYIDRDLRQDLKAASQLVLFWGYAFTFVKGGTFSKKNQSILESKFGLELKEKLISMIQGESSDSATRAVKTGLLNSINEYKKLAPNAAKRELNLILLEIERVTEDRGFFNEILKSIAN